MRGERCTLRKRARKQEAVIREPDHQICMKSLTCYAALGRLGNALAEY